MVTTAEGNFAIFGGYNNSANTVSTMRMLVLDTAGNKLVDKQYGTGFSWSFSGIQCSDGGYALTGYYAANGTSSEQAYLVRTDSKGNVLWQKKYATVGNCYAYHLFQHNSQFVLVGGTQPSNTSALWVLYVDSNGVQTSYDTTHPGLKFTLDTSSIRYRLGQNIMFDTLRGSIQNLAADSLYFVISRTIPSQWIITASVGQRILQADIPDTLAIGPHVMLPLTVIVAPYPERADTEHLCYSVQLRGEAASVQEHCIPLVILAPDAVASEAPSPEITLYPNPAENYISLGGLPSEASAMTYRIFSAVGVEVASGDLSGTDRINITGLASGAYRLQLSQSGQLVANRAFTMLH
jgi:hypothetical protein